MIKHTVALPGRNFDCSVGLGAFFSTSVRTRPTYRANGEVMEALRQNEEWKVLLQTQLLSKTPRIPSTKPDHAN